MKIPKHMFSLPYGIGFYVDGKGYHVDAPSGWKWTTRDYIFNKARWVSRDPINFWMRSNVAPYTIERW